MPNVNKVHLIGHLTRDPVLRYTSGQMAVCEFGLAMSRKYKEKEEVCFVDCTAWGKQAETLQKYVAKGNPLYVEGHLVLDQWEAKDGTKRNKLKVTVDQFQFLGGKKADTEPTDSDAPEDPF